MNEQQISSEINKKDEISGIVLRIERGSVDDGDGFRTVVFLKGCPLRCLWCSTPESQFLEIQHVGNITYGRVMTVDEVMKEVRKDVPFFFHSGGGLTLSGGEILYQPDFTLALLKSAWEECINTAIETSFCGSWEDIHSILQYVNTVYVDIKSFSNELHQTNTGCNSKPILENLLRTNDFSNPLFRLIVRIPIIPGVNDSKKELEEIGKFCSILRHLHHVQLLPYHGLGTETYKKLGMEYSLVDIMPPSSEHMAQCREIIQKYVEQVI